MASYRFMYSSVGSPKFWVGECFDFKRARVFGLGHRLWKKQTKRYARNFWREWPPWLRPCL